MRGLSPLAWYPWTWLSAVTEWRGHSGLPEAGWWRGLIHESSSCRLDLTSASADHCRPRSRLHCNRLGAWTSESRCCSRREWSQCSRICGCYWCFLSGRVHSLTASWAQIHSQLAAEQAGGCSGLALIRCLDSGLAEPSHSICSLYLSRGYFAVCWQH